jgi:sporulation protein YlmC with PRC-barrel domain
MVVALVIASGGPALSRIHHRGHRIDHVNTPAQPAPPPASSGMRTNGEPSPPTGVADVGKTSLPPSLDAKDAEPILGKNVHSSSGEDMGRLVDVIVDTDGRPRAAIIDFGGFLGVGSRKIAVDWSVLKFVPDDPKGNVITVALTKDQVKAAPEFKEGSPVVPLDASGGPPPQPAAPAPAPAPAAPPQSAAPAPAPATPPQAKKK